MIVRYPVDDDLSWQMSGLSDDSSDLSNNGPLLFSDTRVHIQIKSFEWDVQLQRYVKYLECNCFE